MINKYVFTPVVSGRANPIVEENNQDAGHVEEAVLKMATSAEPEVQIWESDIYSLTLSFL